MEGEEVGESAWAHGLALLEANALISGHGLANGDMSIARLSIFQEIARILWNAVA